MLQTTREYIGVVQNVPNGFGFIGIQTVTREDGSPHGLETDADIFIPQSECNAPLTVGLKVAFKVRPDERRGVGHYVACDAQERVIALATAGNRDIHAFMKPVDPVILQQVHANHPLEGVPCDEKGETTPAVIDDAAVRRMLEDYLWSKFPSLNAIKGLDFSVVTADDASNDQRVELHLNDCKTFGMTDQVKKVEEEYVRFKHTRKLLTWILEKGLLRSGTRLSPAILNILVEVVEKVQAVDAKGKTVDDVIAAIDFMIGRELLHPNTVLEMSHLPDLFMAAPVWFFLFRETDTRWKGAGKGDMIKWDSRWNPKKAITDEANWESNFGGMTEGLRYFSKLLETQEWANTFLMFNRRLRNISLYHGDVIPTPIMETMRAGKAVFDYVVIATPYHDQAVREWEDPEWINGLDPYVLGFKNGLPVFFVLGRYSDGGIFPLHDKLMADTIDFVGRNRQKLVAFNTKKMDGMRDSAMTWLEKTEKDWHEQKYDDVGTRFLEHANRLLAAFQAGRLFDWLRGKWILSAPALPGSSGASSMIASEERKALPADGSPTDDDIEDAEIEE